MNNQPSDASTLAPVKVSVIVPVYNSTQFLTQALNAVSAQTLREIEILCVDDGSTDLSTEILANYQADDARFRVLTEAHSGPSVARNRALREAKGEYIAFLDSDDFFEPEMLEKLYTLASTQELDIAICRYDLFYQRKKQFHDSIGADHSEIYAGGKVTSKSEYPDVIFQSTSGYVWNKLFRRAFLEEKNLVFPEKFRVFEDVSFTACALSLAERVAKLQDKLVHHRVYSEQTRNRLFRRYYTEVPEVYLDLKAFLMHHGLYAPLSRSFLDFSASRCYKAYTLLPIEDKHEFWALLHKKYAQELGWDTAAAEDFENEDVASFCADVELHTYSRHLRLKARGLLSPKRWKAALLGNRWTKRIGQKISQVWKNIKPEKRKNDEDPRI